MSRRRAPRPAPERRQRDQRVLVNHRKSDEDYAERMSGGVHVGARERHSAEDRPPRLPPTPRRAKR
jgi:hypothetical protein